MKIVNKLLRFSQLLIAVALVGGYFLRATIYELSVELDLGITYFNFMYAYFVLGVVLLGSIPIRYIVEKIVEAKYLL